MAVMYLTTLLLVQAVPSLATLLLLHRYHFGSGVNGRDNGTLMQSLLTSNGKTASNGAATEGLSDPDVLLRMD
jgi:hypothetical protein